MKKLLIALALPLWAMQANGQTFTTYGSSDPQTIDAGYFSDYSADGTVILPGGSVTLANGSTYEHGNLSFQNNGSWSSQTGSLDLFSVTGPVAISGTTAPDFFNLQLGNAGTVDITNTGGANIASQMLFGTSGLISTDKTSHSVGAIRFADDATYTGGITDAQHVNGYVTKAGNDAFTFPVGEGADVRTLSISAPATAATISAAWFTGSPGTTTDPSDGATHSTTSMGAGIQMIAPVGFWDYILTSGDDDGITIAVSIPNMSSFSSAADLRLAGWNGTQWITLSSGANASGNTENSILTGTIPAGQTITALAIGSAAATPLPVHFSYFNAAANGCKAALEWEAFTDGAFTYFSVERSTDGKTFTEAGRVTMPVSGNKYQFTDEQPTEGVNYYRIKDVGDVANYTSTRQVTIRCNARETIKLYPTVTNGTVYLDMPEGYEDAKILVINVNGQQVALDITKKGLSRTVKLVSAVAGRYLIRVEHNSETETFKILYQP